MLCTKGGTCVSHQIVRIKMSLLDQLIWLYFAFFLKIPLSYTVNKEIKSGKIQN